ncbi:hypothetical protein MAHJHV57_54720 [Mycobacterium avium subsp. hominissuis]
MVSVILGDPDVAVAAATSRRAPSGDESSPPAHRRPGRRSRLRLTARESLNDAELEVARRLLTDVLAGLG